MKDYELLQRDVRCQMHVRKPLYEGMQGFLYLAAALCEEAGEVAGEIKKAYRDSGTMTNERQQKLLVEMGDLLFYYEALCVKLGLDLDTISAANQAKLAKRRERAPGAVG